MSWVGNGVKVIFGDQDSQAPESATDKYAAVWLQVQVFRVWHLAAFVAAIRPVIEHARHHRGLRRFGFAIEWWRLRFRTFGAFDTEESLREFVEQEAHGVIYRRLRGRLGAVSARYGVIEAAHLPRRWDDISESRFLPI
jgi:hypothetical protein